MNDLIELLPLIAIALYYIFRPGKKQEKEQQERRESQAPPEHRERTLEDILREVMEGPKKPERPQRPEPREQPERRFVVEDEPEREVMQVPDLYQSYTGVWDKGEKPESSKDALEGLKIYTEEETVKEKPEVEFDLRQAVINDAILNRPWT